jgi:hypothetical protein
MNIKNKSRMRGVFDTHTKSIVPNKFAIIIESTGKGNHGLDANTINPQYEKILYHGSIN